MNNGGPAFPGVQEYRVSNHSQSQVMIEKALMPGMTLLDYFAAKALQGLCANSGGPFQGNGASGWGIVNCSVDDVAMEAYGIADAMLKAREAR